MRERAEDDEHQLHGHGVAGELGDAPFGLGSRRKGLDRRLRSSLVRTPLIGLRRLLCSLYVPAVTGLTTLENLSTANFSAAFECPQSLSLRSIVSP